MRSECKRFRELALGSDSLVSAEREELEAHLSFCTACRAELGWLSEVVSQVEQRGAIEISPEADARMLERLRPAMREAAARQHRRSSRGWAFSLAAATAAAGVAIVGLLILHLVRRAGPGGPPPMRPAQAEILARSGQVRISTGSVPGGLHHDQEQISVGATVSTEARSEILLALGADRGRLEPASSVAIHELTSSSTQLALARGEMVLEVDPRDHARFSVRTPFGTVSVTGTRFRLSTLGGGSVTTSRGSVQVSLEGGGEYHVGAGQTLKVQGRRVEHAAAADLESMESALPFPGPAESRVPLLITGQPLGARVFLDGKLLGHTPLFVRWPAGSVRCRIDAGPGELIRMVQLRAGQPEQLHYDLSALPASAPSTPASRPVAGHSAPIRARSALAPATRARLVALVRGGECTTAEQLARTLNEPSPHARAEALALAAECYHARQQDAAALTLYRRVQRRYAATPTAANALFEIGRLEEKAGRPAAARVAFSTYRNRYAAGPLAGEALFHLCRLEARPAAALRCYERYCRAYPRGTQLEAALFGRLECLRQLDDARFEAEARAYLRRFPGGLRAKRVTSWLK